MTDRGLSILVTWDDPVAILNKTSVPLKLVLPDLLYTRNKVTRYFSLHRGPAQWAGRSETGIFFHPKRPVVYGGTKLKKNHILSVPY